MIIRVRVLVSLIWYSSYCHARFSVIFTPTPKHLCVQPLPQYFSARNLGPLKGPGIGYLKKTPQCHGAFHSTKILVWKFENSTCQMERFIPVPQIRSKPQGVCLLFLLQAGNGSFHLISNQKLRIFGLNGKRPRKIGCNKFMMYEKWHQRACVTVEIGKNHWPRDLTPTYYLS